MLLGVFLYAYATGVRSSRQIEWRCTEDIAFRILSGNSAPDHVTIARFRARHEQALAGFLVASLRLCQAAGLVRLGLVCLDGTKLAADASAAANRTHATLEDQVAELLREAAEADPRRRCPARRCPRRRAPAAAGRPPGPARPAAPGQAQLEHDAAERQRRYEQRVAALAAGARARGQQPRAHIRPRPRDEAPRPDATANTTDPDSRFVRSHGGIIQGYNAQAVTTTEQIIIAAELTQAVDLQQLAPCSPPPGALWPRPGSPSGRPGWLPTAAIGRLPT
jgi:hypothetical protein